MDNIFGDNTQKQGEYYERLTVNFGKASECVECGQCEDVCPQHLPIRDHLKTIAGYFEKIN